MTSADQTNALGAVGILPRRLGRYELITPIGRGGMAIVYAGRATGSAGFERMVAVKVCFQTIREEPRFREMFLDEAKVAAHIHHPNVVATLDARDDDELYLVMDYVQGGSLAQIMRAVGRDGGAIPTAIGMRICVEALAGLHAAHNTRDSLGRALDLVHRDVSPQNIMVGIDGVSRIVDFGIAKAVGREAETRTGEVKGKMAYLAPEQLLAEALTPRTDVFAMGVVLWEALAGRKLFGGGSLEETVMALAELRIPPIRESRPEVTEKVEAILRKAMQRDPADRFQTAGEMADALEAADMTVAPQKEVAAYVEKLLGDKLHARTELIRKASEQAAAEYAGEKRPTIMPKPDVIVDATQEDPSETPAPHELSLIGLSSSPRARWFRRNGLLVGAGTLFALTLVAVLRFRGSHAVDAAPPRDNSRSGASTHAARPAAVDRATHAASTPNVVVPAAITPPVAAPVSAPALANAAPTAVPSSAAPPNANPVTATRHNPIATTPQTGARATTGTATTPVGNVPPRTRRRREYRPEML